MLLPLVGTMCTDIILLSFILPRLVYQIFIFVLPIHTPCPPPTLVLLLYNIVNILLNNIANIHLYIANTLLYIANILLYNLNILLSVCPAGRLAHQIYWRETILTSIQKSFSLISNCKKNV
jgi:hypothetical protein